MNVHFILSIEYLIAFAVFIFASAQTTQLLRRVSGNGRTIRMCWGDHWGWHERTSQVGPCVYDATRSAGDTAAISISMS